MRQAGDMQRCLCMIGELDVEQGWGLTLQTQKHYAQRFAARYGDMSGVGDAQLRVMLCNYHTEHPLVEALTDPVHPDHADRWSEWTKQALRQLACRYPGSSVADESTVSLEDLAQEAVYDLWRGLRTYRYQSRFHTWAYTVISNCFLRHHRSIKTQKRRDLSRTQSLDAILAVGDTLYDPKTQLPDEIAMSDVLVDLLQHVLGQHPDQRLSTIFRLWAYEEQTLRTIGLQLNLSVTRVHGLLTQAIALLRDELMNQDWVEEHSSETIAT